MRPFSTLDNIISHEVLEPHEGKVVYIKRIDHRDRFG